MDKLPRNRAPLFALLTISSLALDLWSKDWAFAKFGVRNGSPWLVDSSVRFRWFTSLNEGALWGMGQGFAWAFALLSVVAFGGILFWLFAKSGAQSLWLTISLAFVSGGTLGNLYDRLGLHGITVPGKTESVKAVRDFFHFQFGGTVDNPALDWAIFNVADICLVTGAIMLMLQSIFVPEIPSETKSTAEAEAQATV